MSEHPAASPPHSRQELLNIVDRLIAEFPDQPAGVVIAQVVQARDRHRRAGARGRPHVVTGVERAARERILSARSA